MLRKIDPFNLKLLIPKEDINKRVKPVTELTIFESQTKNFHPRGMFSTDIFGIVGGDKRNSIFSYVDLKLPIFHPLVYISLVNLKALYGDIMSGKKYAVWDNKIKNFIPSNISEGETGFSFFLKHFKDIVFEERESKLRGKVIQLINDNKDNVIMTKFLILPAGLRDYTIDEAGKPSESDVNELYRKLIVLSNLVNVDLSKQDLSFFDGTSYSIQVAAVKIYTYFEDTLLSGKKKFPAGKWAKRAVFNSTRNVITTIPMEADSLYSHKIIKYNETVIGLYQYVKSILPFIVFQFKSGILGEIFEAEALTAKLVNKKTLSLEYIDVSIGEKDAWAGSEGIEQTLNKFAHEEIRHNYVTVGDDHYLALIYRDKNSFKIFSDINELPSNLSKDNVRPITFAEVLYFHVFKDVSKFFAIMVRYPVTKLGSSYPSKLHLKTTVETESIYELNDNWEKTDVVAKEAPILGESFYNSLSPHFSRLARLGGDFDGDTMGATTMYTDEANNEIRKLLNSKKFYLAPDGRLAYSSDIDTLSLVMKSITG